MALGDEFVSPDVSLCRGGRPRVVPGARRVVSGVRGYVGAGCSSAPCALLRTLVAPDGQLEVLVNEQTSLSQSGVDPFGVFASSVRVDGAVHVVSMVGEIDMASREAALGACVAGENHDVVVDLTNVGFMDCAGFRALGESQVALERRGGSLQLTNARGEPLRLLALLGQISDVPNVARSATVSATTPSTGQ